MRFSFNQVGRRSWNFIVTKTTLWILNWLYILDQKVESDCTSWTWFQGMICSCHHLTPLKKCIPITSYFDATHPLENFCWHNWDEALIETLLSEHSVQESKYEAPFTATEPRFRKRLQKQQEEEMKMTLGLPEQVILILEVFFLSISFILASAMWSIRLTLAPCSKPGAKTEKYRWPRFCLLRPNDLYIYTVYILMSLYIFFISCSETLSITKCLYVCNRGDS